ncbi:MAG: YkgJ family cysteine cluster protein [Candidatus Obscuribacter sp.]|nr:YkgJ family cysteine cluster protein [Candidatus Obscuribacter sp.]
MPDQPAQDLPQQDSPKDHATPANAALTLLIPEGVRYNCQGCGRCCSGWSVGMTQEDYDRIKHVDWQSLHPKLAGKELFIHREKEFEAGVAGHPHYTKPREDGTCPFLIDKLCFIHGHLGEDQKPLTCRIFPYSFVETPSGVYTGVVYNSMAAAQNAGNLLSDQRESLMDYLSLTRDYARAIHRMPGTPPAPGVTNNPEAASAAGVSAPTAADSTTANPSVAAPDATPAMPSAPRTVKIDQSPNSTVELTMGLSITWAEFLHVEDKLMDTVLNRKDLDIFQLLPAGSEIFNMAIKLKRAGEPMSKLKDFDPVVPRSGDVTPGGVEEMTLRAMFYRFYIYPSIRVDEKDLWQMQKTNVSKNMFTVVRSFAKYSSSAIDTIVLKHGKVPIVGRMDLDKSLKRKFKPFNSDINEFFRRWIYLKLFAKTYFGAPAAGFCVVSGYNCLMSAFISAVLFAKCNAIHRKQDEIVIEDLHEAYWRLDRELLTMSQVSINESKAYNFAFAVPRLFHKMLYSLEDSLKA